MRFWDSSAVLPLLVQEPSSGRLDARLREDPTMVVWWGTPPECASVLARLQASRALSPQAYQAASERLRHLAGGWVEVLPSEAVREQAARLVRVHGLKTAAGFQLSAALVAASFRSSELELITFDPRLAAAAQQEGFPLLQEGLPKKPR